MKPDLLIIGAGIAGQSCRWAAEKAGLTALCIAPAPVPLEVGSWAAIGISRVSWMHSAQQRKRSIRSIELLRERSLVLHDCAVAFKKGKEPAELSDYYAVDVANALPAADLEGTAEMVQPRCALVYRNGKSELMEARLGVIVCAGVNNQKLGAPAPAKTTYGATFIGDAHQPRRRMRMWRLRPYVDLFEGCGGTDYRLGSSTAKNPDKAAYELGKMCMSAGILEEGKCVVGLRVHRNDELSKGLEVDWSKDVPYFWGFGKFGYQLAPAMAEELVEALCAR